MTYIFIGIILAGGLGFYLTICGNKSTANDNQLAVDQDTTNHKNSVNNKTSSMQTIDIVDKYINSDDKTRQSIEKEVGQSEMTLASLLGFIDNCAVLAVQQKDVENIYKGLYANVIEGCRQDFRDNIIGLTKLYHSCIILGLDPDKEFLKVASKTSGQGKDLIEKFVNRKPVDKTLQCMGLKTTFTPKFDFIQVDFDDKYLMETEYSEITDKQLMNGSH